MDNRQNKIPTLKKLNEPVQLRKRVDQEQQEAFMNHNRKFFVLPKEAKLTFLTK